MQDLRHIFYPFESFILPQYRYLGYIRHRYTINTSNSYIYVVETHIYTPLFLWGRSDFSAFSFSNSFCQPLNPIRFIYQPNYSSTQHHINLNHINTVQSTKKRTKRELDNKVEKDRGTLTGVSIALS